MAENGIRKRESLTITIDVLRYEHSLTNYQNIINEQYLDAGTLVPTGGIFNNIINGNNLSSANMREVYDYVLNGMHYGKPKLKDNSDPYYSQLPQQIKNDVTKDDVVDFYLKSTSENGSYTFGNGNSIYACDIGVGNCTDYHSYFLSLSRTLDVPARFHMGFPIPDGDVGEIGGYHCWADYYIEGEGWTPVDISEADKNPKSADYFFGTLDDNRIEFMVGRDFELENYNGGAVNIFIYPLLETDDERSFAFTKKFSFRNL